MGGITKALSGNALPDPCRSITEPGEALFVVAKSTRSKRTLLDDTRVNYGERNKSNYWRNQPPGAYIMSNENEPGKYRKNDAGKKTSITNLNKLPLEAALARAPAGGAGIIFFERVQATA